VKRLLLAVLILWGATHAFPSLGQRAEPRVSAVKGWVGEQMHGPMTPIRNRYHKAQVRSHLDKAARALVTQRNMGGRPPEQEDLRLFMSRNDIVEDGLDPWGMPYLIVQEPDSVAVISAGPDRTYHTEDDMVARVRFAERRPTRRPFR
jgi:hypothetical protein